MLGQEVLLYLKNGYVEPVECWNFKIDFDKGIPSMFFRVSQKEVYIVPLSSIHHFDVRHVWIFDQWLPPEDNQNSTPCH